jgi:hypothetical protein
MPGIINHNGTAVSIEAEWLFETQVAEAEERAMVREVNLRRP